MITEIKNYSDYSPTLRSGIHLTISSSLIFIIMNLQESIRRILREETNFMRIIMRRFPPERLESEFQDSLNYVSKIFLSSYSADSKKLTKKQFIWMVIQDLIDGIELTRILPADLEWMRDVQNSLTEHYIERITSMYNVLKK